MSETVNELAASEAKRWGRSLEASLPIKACCFALIFGAPLIVIYFVLSCLGYGGSLLAPAIDWLTGSQTIWMSLSRALVFTWKAVLIFGGWVFFQALLATFVPDGLSRWLPGYRGGKQLGAVTPAGLRLSYQINGLQSWCLSVLAFVLGAYVFKLFSPTVIYDNWGPLLWATFLSGNVLAFFVYIKALLFPSHRDDRKFSGSLLYDYYMGVELNPRIGRLDLKLFFNGRPGIVAWTLINLSFAAKQFQLYGTVTNSMLLVNLLHALYVIYFFWNEAWYLRTIDMSHDHFGWMLSFGDCSWLPFMYTLQGLYLVQNPVRLSPVLAATVLAMGVIGFWIFAAANNQKERFRRSEGKITVWGKPAEAISCTYRAANGETHKSTLLASGWWGVARHFNYTGDLIGCLAYSLACGFGHILPYFYLVYMTILLVHRCYRDEQRCLAKYGASWEEYCKRVPYRLIPGIF